MGLWEPKVSVVGRSFEHMSEALIDGSTTGKGAGAGVLSAAEFASLVEPVWDLAAGVEGAVEGAVGGDAARAGSSVGSSLDAGLIDEIRFWEELKSVASARQVRATAVFAASQRETQCAAGMRAREVGKGIGAQVALARRDGAHKGSRHLGVAEALAHEMPHTLAALDAGVISEWRATVMVRETACVTSEDRRRWTRRWRPGPVGWRVWVMAR